jgi:hypothetical protein
MTTNLVNSVNAGYEKGTYQTLRCLAHIRYVRRDGSLVLQHAFEIMETGKVEWRDVPIVDETKGE